MIIGITISMYKQNVTQNNFEFITLKRILQFGHLKYNGNAESDKSKGLTLFRQFGQLLITFLVILTLS